MIVPKSPRAQPFLVIAKAELALVAGEDKRRQLRSGVARNYAASAFDLIAR
jgi:hypothetical protein